MHRAREMPVETALGHAEAPRQRLHRDGADTLFSNQIEGRLGPVFGTQAAVAAGARFAGGSVRLIHGLI
jgi:hypothetical protein